MRREEIELRVDALSAKSSGKDFAVAVERLADQLDEPGRKLLGEVLLERAGEREAEQYEDATRRLGAERWRMFLPGIGRRRPPTR